MKIRHYQSGPFLTIFVIQLLFMPLDTGVICSLLFLMIGYELRLITSNINTVYKSILWNG